MEVNKLFGKLPGLGSGSGSSLPFPVLLLAGLATVTATVVSATSILLHLKNYRKPVLQRMVVRIMVMVPIYAISSFISLFSLQAAFFIDVIRDIYEAFVIYCFFDLLIAYLGGERSLLILLHGRPPKYPIFPGSIFWKEVDVSDPHTFLFLKRGVIQYVQVKPMLALVTIILKLIGKFNEGDLRANSGYLYVSIVYNTSICLSLYCLAIFWMCVNDDLRPFRPMPKFLCVKGILFFSFWQSILISILVAAGAIKKLGPYTDNEHISLGLTDTLICLEMPVFAVAHMYAFATRDFMDPRTSFVARMPVLYAFRDAFGFKDVVEDIKATLRGEGMDYREFEPSEGFIHQGAGRDRRIRAGLRYSQGGKKKYWLPQHAPSMRPPGVVERRVNKIVERFAGQDQGEEVYAPLLPGQAEEVVHTAEDLWTSQGEGPSLFDSDPTEDEGFGLHFGDIDEADEELFEHSKKYLFGDYLYPSVDVSSEAARQSMWDEEERILRDERGAYFSPLTRPGRALGAARQNYGAMGNFQRSVIRERHDSSGSESGHGKGKTRIEGGMAQRQVIIDKEHDRLPEAKMGEVKLRWTSREHTPAQSPRARTLSASAQPILARASSSSTSPTDSPQSRQPPPSPRKETERAVLPPDAVDLVVEDHHAAEEEMTHERRKGEPAVRGSALHKVYRRGYLAEDEQGQREEGEVEVQEGEDTLFEVGDEVDEIIGAQDEAVGELTVVTGTPLAHARTAMFSPEILDDENPWA
ncbi:uncharacterized protein FIBRA_07508 [Fibroporia radiculosa]|uniref:DUF300-domain-containing protein n=1 Tax=Fibroporia radiculosa TaxID=599839 RepID=J4H4N4_9APHY|nr:uncharacterized protein FIBRA_07508 [Fibroporia radiculosa]CCM05294.1 predicted protein [Fibroporia radiculosa]